MRLGIGENLFSIRKCQSSENARIIDWKATAKTGELMAREYAHEEDSRCCLILDAHVNDPHSQESRIIFEKAVSLTASIAAHFLGEGTGIEYLTPSEYIPWGTGIHHLYRILKSLAIVQCEADPFEKSADCWESDNFPAVSDNRTLSDILSEKVFKIIVTSKPRGSFPTAIWRSSHVVFFDEL